MKRSSLAHTPCDQTPVVILAGGLGTRLAPYTTVLPKPLMPVGRYPILEILLRQLAREGFQNVTLAVGHMAGLIQAYFKDGSDFGVSLTYSCETSPLGTAGPLALLPATTRNTLVLNGDLLTTLCFSDVVRYHEREHALATIGMTRRQETIDFGVIDTGAGNRIRDYREKPRTSHLVSMGIYVFSPEVRRFIPKGQRLDFPELVRRLMHANGNVLGYETDAYWLDIGRPADYERANQEFPQMESFFFRHEVATAAIGS